MAHCLNELCEGGKKCDCDCTGCILALGIEDENTDGMGEEGEEGELEALGEEIEEEDE